MVVSRSRITNGGCGRKLQLSYSHPALLFTFASKCELKHTNTCTHCIEFFNFKLQKVSMFTPPIWNLNHKGDGGNHSSTMKLKHYKAHVTILVISTIKKGTKESISRRHKSRNKPRCITSSVRWRLLSNGCRLLLIAEVQQGRGNNFAVVYDSLTAWGGSLYASRSEVCSIIFPRALHAFFPPGVGISDTQNIENIVLDCLDLLKTLIVEPACTCELSKTS
jgi:hypothetical protein